MFKLNFYVPKTHLEEVKLALFALGAGKMGHYDSCCWQTLGQGQFRGLPDSSPFLGQKGELEKLDEYKVEMLCEDALIQEVIEVLRQVHPYEEPAYDVIRLEQVG